MLTSFGASNRDPTLVQIQKSHGVDAFMVLEPTNDMVLQQQRHRHGQDRQTGLGLSMPALSPEFASDSRAAMHEVEEGVLRYQNGVDSGSLSV